MSQDPLSRKLEMLSKLPELVRILRCLFVGEKKVALLWGNVVSKVCDSMLSRMASGKYLHILKAIAWSNLCFSSNLNRALSMV